MAISSPQTEFVRPCNLCPHMQRITLPKILRSLQTMTHEALVAVSYTHLDVYKRQLRAPAGQALRQGQERCQLLGLLRGIRPGPLQWQAAPHARQAAVEPFDGSLRVLAGLGGVHQFIPVGHMGVYASTGFGTTRRSAETVSYTHLDVYKRQPPTFPPDQC